MDVVIFTVLEGKLQALLMEMKKRPFLGAWAVPGGLIRPDESVDDAAKRQLREKVGINNLYLEQLYTFGKVKRDPFGRVVSVAHFALIPSAESDIKKDQYNLSWFPVAALPESAYDHKEIIETAIERLKSKLAYTNIVYSLLPNEFTLGELQKIYEIILGKALDKRNFRKKILQTKLLKKIPKKTIGDAHRPAQVYSFAKRTPQFIEIM